VVLIIDDLGYQWRNGMAMVELPGKLNLAILPHTPHGARLAEAGFAAGKEVLLHAPMSNRAGEPVERGALTPTMSREIFDATLGEALDAVPHVRGVNNHMGSELTEHSLQMGWLMQTLLRRQLYFVDSRTSADTVAASTAADFSVPHLSRSVFLDNERSRPAIDYFFRRLLARAETDGTAVGIGHPYPETADYLREAIPRLRCRGVRLALVSEVLSRPAPAATPREENAYNPASEPYFDAALSHVGLGLGYRELTEVEDAGSEHRVGAPEDNAFHQVIEVSHAP
jgi:polysaccharide deacetylase 2 family uncharacterized protein YibQ